MVWVGKCCVSVPDPYGKELYLGPTQLLSHCGGGGGVVRGVWPEPTPTPIRNPSAGEQLKGSALGLTYAPDSPATAVGPLMKRLLGAVQDFILSGCVTPNAKTAHEQPQHPQPPSRIHHA